MRRVPLLEIALGALAGSILCVTARAADEAPRQSVAVIVHGDGDAISEVKAAVTAAANVPVDLRMADLPSTVARAVEDGASDVELAEVRKDYVNANFPACLRKLEGDDLVPALLGSGKRVAASRVLLWRVACRVGSNERELALRDAREMADYGLDLPSDVAGTSPEVEALIARAAKETAVAPPVTVHLTSGGAAGALAVDGRSSACATPCTIDLTPGRHVFRVEVDGMAPAIKVAYVDAANNAVAIATVAATPEVAAQQWLGRYAGTPEIDSAPSLRLLSSALRAPVLVLVNAENEGGSLRLRGALAKDGVVEARAERRASAGSEKKEVEGLLGDLLVKGHVVEPAPAIWARPVFWIVVVAVAGAAAGGTAWVLTHPPPAQVSFQ